MKLRMDKLGRIVVPKPLRRSLGLRAEAELEMVEQGGALLLRPASQQPSMINVDGIWIHTGTAQPGVKWERLLDEIRDERLADLLRT